MVDIKKKSKSIDKLKKGDKIKVDGRELEIDAHQVMIDHGNTKEMVLEIFDPKTDEDFQIRYFNDQMETSLEFYKLENEFMYQREEMKKIEW
jgi:hypothetical protein